MSATNETQQDTVTPLLTQQALEQRLYDYTESQFERDKTERMKALASALAAALEAKEPASYGESKADSLMAMLVTTSGLYYQPRLFVFNSGT